MSGSDCRVCGLDDRQGFHAPIFLSHLGSQPSFKTRSILPSVYIRVWFVRVYSINMTVYKGVYIRLNSCGVASFILCELGVNGSPFQACLQRKIMRLTVTQECKMLHSHSAEIVEF